MNEINIYCLSLFKSDYKNIIRKNYIPVGLGNENFVEGWLTDKKGKNISQRTHIMESIPFIIIYGRTTLLIKITTAG